MFTSIQPIYQESAVDVRSIVEPRLVFRVGQRLTLIVVPGNVLPLRPVKIEWDAWRGIVITTVGARAAIVHEGSSL